MITEVGPLARSYNKLWKLMIDKKINKTQLCKAAGITTNAMAKLGRDESVPLETLEKICSTLNCGIDDIVDIDFDSGVITDETTGKTYQGQAFPPFMQNLISKGGLINYINSKAE